MQPPAPNAAFSPLAPVDQEVVMFSGLVVEFAESYGVSFLVRGLRAYSGTTALCHACTAAPTM